MAYALMTLYATFAVVGVSRLRRDGAGGASAASDIIMFYAIGAAAYDSVV